MEILLPQIFSVVQPEKYKLHLACWNGTQQPLDIFVRDRNEWNGWNSWRGIRDDFSREYIFSLIDFYPEKDRWLFGGAYQVLSRKAINHSNSYEIELLRDSQPFIGRMKLFLKRPSRSKSVNFENHYDRLIVEEILSKPYAGEMFCGYEEINIGFPMLEIIFSIQSPDWKAALENVKGIYLITDTSNGKRYVGSAYGDTGIWSRWSCYIKTGHGFNDELTKLISITGIEYARQYFRFSLLEYRAMKTDDNSIFQREQYWKNVLLTRGEYGYNKN